MSTSDPLLEIENLKVIFHGDRGSATHAVGGLDLTCNVVRLQTGYLYHYAFAMLIGVAGLITWFMFGLGGQ